MKKLRSSVLLCLLFCGCTTTAITKKYPIPAHVPIEAEPVWLMYYAMESDDFDLFVKTLSRETRDFMRQRMGMKEAFESGKRGSNIPLHTLRFTVSDRDETKFPNARLKKEYRFIQIRHPKGSGGTITHKTDAGHWKVAYPSTTPVPEMIGTVEVHPALSR